MNTKEHTTVLCIGSLGEDIFFPTDQGNIQETPEDILSQKKIAFELGAKIYIKDRTESIGGCAANVATAISLLGTKTEIISAVGNDQTGQWLENELNQKGVSTQNLQRLEGHKSDMSIIIVDKNSGQRTIFVSRDVGELLDIKAENLTKPTYLYIASLHGQWKKNIDTIIEYAKNTDIKIIFNPGQHNLREDIRKVTELISQTHTLFVNKDEALEILSQNNLDYGDGNNIQILTQKLCDLGAKTVVITDGQNGAWTLEEDIFYTACCLSHTATDTTGAGDSFLSGFIGAKCKEKDTETALRWATANATSVVKKYGATPGLIGEKDIDNEAKAVKVTKEKQNIQ